MHCRTMNRSYRRRTASEFNGFEVGEQANKQAGKQTSASAVRFAKSGLGFKFPDVFDSFQDRRVTVGEKYFQRMRGQV